MTSGRIHTDLHADRGLCWRASSARLAGIEIERLISRCGLKVVDHPARADLEQRYFAGRTDGLRPYTLETLVTARVI